MSPLNKTILRMFRKNPTIPIRVCRAMKERKNVHFYWSKVMRKCCMQMQKKNALAKFAYAQFAPLICNQAQERRRRRWKKALEILLSIGWHA